ncbi:MAG: TolB family protein, partial [Gemmatimonadota bacterium]
MRIPTPFRSPVGVVGALLLPLAAIAGPLAPLAAQEEAADATDATYRVPAPGLVAIVDAPVPPAVSVSPDRTTLLLMERPPLPPIAEVSEPELRLAGLRINPRTNGPSRARPYTDLSLRGLDRSDRPIAGLPEEPRLRNVRWSPDGRSVAFTHDAGDRVELWVADVETARARRLIDVAVNDAYYGASYEWLSDGRTLIVRTVPGGRGEPPAEVRVPTGPVIEEVAGEAAPARTYQDLLEDPYDEVLFEHYATSLLQRVGLDGRATALGEPGIIGTASPSPDGRWLLVETTHRPFSTLVPAYRFPNRIEVWDAAGNVVETIADLPLQEQVPTAFGSVPTGVRSIDWRDDAPATLIWVEALDGGDAHAEAEERDRLFMLEAPFDGEPTPIATLPLRYSGVQWAPEGFGLLYEAWWSTRTRRVYRIDPERPGEKEVVFDYSYEDRYNDPGRPLTRDTDRGTSVLITADGGRSIFLVGSGASPEGNRPFLRRLDLESGETEELFRSEAPYYE